MLQYDPQHVRAFRDDRGTASVVLWAETAPTSVSSKASVSLLC
jgi:hypothetical protein